MKAMRQRLLVPLFVLSCGNQQAASMAIDGGAGDGAEARAPLAPPAKHRGAAVSCDATRPPGYNADAGSYDAGAPVAQCTSDSECVDGGKNGRCTPIRDGPFCMFDECALDVDCPDGGVCSCGTPANPGRTPNLCLPSNCRVDSDCGAGGFCSPSVALYCVLDVSGYYCHTPNDDCTNDSDCASGSYCTWQPEVGKWACGKFVCNG
jgi:hypothetical protein